MGKQIFISLCVSVLIVCFNPLKAQVLEKEQTDQQKQLEEQQAQIKELQEEMRLLKEQLKGNQTQQVSQTQPKTEEVKNTSNEEKEINKGPVYINKGKVFGRIFMDYANNLSRAHDRRQGYDISRAYLGYDYQITEEFSARVMIDAAPEGVQSQTGPSDVSNVKNPILKNAYLRYKKGDKFYVIGGMFTTLENATYQKYWQNRYIAKGLAVESKMDKGTDIGLAGAYKINDIVSVEASVMSGEGYKKINKNGYYLYTIGVPLQITKNFEFKPLYSIRTGGNDNLKDKMFMSFMAGYKNKHISAGLEFAETFNDEQDNVNKYGYSVFVNGKLNDKFKLLGRFDLVKTTESAKSYSGYDIYGTTNAFAGHYNLAIFGLEYRPIKNLKLAPTYILRTMKDASITQKDINTNSIFLFCELNF